ncbi:MAG TPA: hypothetical protein PLI93_03470 [Gemmatimonadales bacterium]|nr:hypothetical protein [Gemmatimonadota bacterium]MCA9767939.1 hypothetical protein [Gemmatimonadota bacterium]HPF61098.1 hypothetical protein [Gemmatimonadales bacterium]HRX17822.1 hypothetical protein [Gemmatimonadales bacterium]
MLRCLAAIALTPVMLTAQVPAITMATAPADGSAEAEVVAVATAALTAITAGDWTRLTDLMVPESQIHVSVQRDGTWAHRMRTREAERGNTGARLLVERGWDPIVRVAGGMAIAWVPYDIYVDGKWSHCGVDLFTMMRIGSEWKLVGLAYTVEQPPACRPHPNGAPPGTTGTPGAP